MRGGTANCAVIISDEKIRSPIVEKADGCVVMNLPSLELFTPRVCPGGILVINSSLVNRKPDRKDIRCVEVPATEIANQLGNSRGANLVALGAFIEATQMTKPASIFKALKLVLPPHRLNTLPLNKKSFQEGREWTLRAGK
jgi:2-oxoglutarate ferredoxin oxidoreductase subunit gamma